MVLDKSVQLMGYLNCHVPDVQTARLHAMCHTSSKLIACHVNCSDMQPNLDFDLTGHEDHSEGSRPEVDQEITWEVSVHPSDMGPQSIDIDLRRVNDVVT